MTRSPYFSTAERLIALDKEAHTWRGTPFRAHGAAKGPAGGVSCHTLAHALGQFAGWLPRSLSLPRLSLRQWRTHRLSAITPFVETDLRDCLEAVPISQTDHPRVGDLLWFTDDDCEHLATVIAGDRFIHALLPEGVQFGTLADATFSARLQKIWRPVERTT